MGEKPQKCNKNFDKFDWENLGQIIISPKNNLTELTFPKKISFSRKVDEMFGPIRHFQGNTSTPSPQSLPPSFIIVSLFTISPLKTQLLI